MDAALATIVAASGAFPTVFTPVWTDNSAYMDGGVLENLGLEGLDQFVNGQKSNPIPPRVLIISDVSAPDTSGENLRPTIFSSTVRAFNALHGAREKEFRSRYIEVAKSPRERAPSPFAICWGSSSDATG